MAFLSAQDFSAAENGGDIYTEVGGVPKRTSILGTDGMFDSSSVSAGESLKMPDGTLIQWLNPLTLTFANGSVLNGTWTFPVAFIDTSCVIDCLMVDGLYSATPNKTELSIFKVEGFPGTTDVTIGLERQSGAADFVSGDTVGIMVKALGRWK